MVLSVVGLRVDWKIVKRVKAAPGETAEAQYSHPGMSMGSASTSAEEKHSTSAISESEEATNAPSAVIREKDEHNVSDIVNESMRLTKPECSSKAETSELNPRGYRVPLLPQPKGEP